MMPVNKGATSPALANWAKKNSTHDNLATSVFNTKAPDLVEEKNRVLEELKQKGDENLK